MVVLTVYHDGQFWTGVAERNENGALKAVRTVFGCEPTERDVLEFAHRAIREALDAAKESVEAPLPASPMNPKRRQREIRREIAAAQGPSTKAQSALQREREARGAERKKTTRLLREEAEERKRLLLVAKKKEKHRGR